MLHDVDACHKGQDAVTEGQPEDIGGDTWLVRMNKPVIECDDVMVTQERVDANITAADVDEESVSGSRTQQWPEPPCGQSVPAVGIPSEPVVESADGSPESSHPRPLS